jgi:hypothetical protein
LKPDCPHQEALDFREGIVTKKAAVQDTRLVVQLERMYEDAEMRKARLWWRNEFWPEAAADYLRVEAALGTRENDWLGQLVGYWGMAAALVLQGTLSEQALFDARFSVEMFDVFCKVQPFLKRIRDGARRPGLLRNMEELILRSKDGRQRLAQAIRQSTAGRKKAVHRLAKAG